MSNIVGSLSWEGCIECKHYREEEGGCAPLDADGAEILSLAEFESDYVICEQFEVKT